MEFGVIYKPSCAWREANNEAEARDCFEHAPQPDGETAVLIINGDEVESRQPDNESHEESEYYAELERGYSQDRI